MSRNSNSSSTSTSTSTTISTSPKRKPVSHDDAKDNEVDVFINGRYVKDLQMVVQKNGFCLFEHSNSQKPAQNILNRLRNKKIIHPGRNILRFENSYTSRGANSRKRYAECFLYVWDSTDLIVISDVDGTVTKSDVIGLLSNAVESYDSHTHKGVNQFYTDLSNLNLRFVYLTSRPISLMSYTRKFLVSTVQDDVHLPRGLTLCHPGSVKDVLYTEVVAKNPDVFKADAITRQIILPFAVAGRSTDSKLFVAGFGNKITDMKAYSACGMDLDDIYIINKSSNVLCESDRSLVALEQFDSKGGIGATFKKNRIMKKMPENIKQSLAKEQQERSTSPNKSRTGSMVTSLFSSNRSRSGNGVDNNNNNNNIDKSPDMAAAAAAASANLEDFTLDLFRQNPKTDDEDGVEVITRMEMAPCQQKMRRQSYARVRTVSESGQITSQLSQINTINDDVGSTTAGAEVENFGNKKDLSLNSYNDGRLLLKISSVVQEIQQQQEDQLQVLSERKRTDSVVGT